MGSDFDDLINKVQVIFQIVLLFRVLIRKLVNAAERKERGTYKKITRNAHGPFYHTTGFLHGFHTYFKLINVVESIEDTEYVDTVSLCLLTEMEDGIVGQPATVSKGKTMVNQITYEEYATPLAPRSNIWKGMFGTALLSFLSRSQGSS